MELFRTSDGADLAYEDDGEGRPIVLLHGWAANSRFFNAQRIALRSQFRVITLDMRGHGRSAPGAASLETAATDFEELIDALDLKGAIAVGWSMGAMVLWRALQGPQAWRISGVVSEDMTPRIINDAEWSLGIAGGYDETAARLAGEAMVRDWAAYVAASAPRLFALGRERADLVAWAASEMAGCDPKVMARYWSSMAAADFRTGLTACLAPARIVCGGLSQLYSLGASAYVAAQMPRAQRVVFVSSGHSPHLEEPEAFNAMIQEFAAEITAQMQAASTLTAPKTGREL
jgi:pimeloyl-[acyl-carrier protein] methyl ester esterase